MNYSNSRCLVRIALFYVNYFQPGHMFKSVYAAVVSHLLLCKQIFAVEHQCKWTII